MINTGLQAGAETIRNPKAVSTAGDSVSETHTGLKAGVNEKFWDRN